MGLDMYLLAGEREESVAYWRKANAVHKWFVDNVQDGVDECQLSIVRREKLVELRDLAGVVLKQPERAPELLPTTDGFFFGGTEYDDWYMRNLQATVRQIDDVLAKYPGNFAYQSSW